MNPQISKNEKTTYIYTKHIKKKNNKIFSPYYTLYQFFIIEASQVCREMFGQLLITMNFPNVERIAMIICD